MRIVFVDLETPWIKEISPDAFTLEELCMATRAKIVSSTTLPAIEADKVLRRLSWFKFPGFNWRTDALGPNLAAEAKRWAEDKVDIESYIVIKKDGRFQREEYDISYKVLTS